MSAKDELRLKILGDFREGKISREEAATVLGVHWRTIARWTSKIRKDGPVGILHGNKGKTPINRTADETKAEMMLLVKNRYFDFNMAHCFEILVRDHGLSVCYSTFWGWCRSMGLGKRKRRRASKARLARERMACRGLMLQMDGSEHAWNGKDKWSLVGAIDDASSDLPGIAFFEKENTWSCMKVLRTIVEKEGVPVSLYVDQAKWFGGLKAEQRTQFARVCTELGVTLIPALSPQAKGRIERTWRTFQDRLIPELRLQGIKTMAEANRYLQETFLPEYWDCRNTVSPRSDESRYRSVDHRLDLDEIFCKKHERLVRQDHTIHFENVTYRLIPTFTGSIAGKTVSIHEYENGSWRVYYGPLEVKATRFLTGKRRRWDRAS